MLRLLARQEEFENVVAEFETGKKQPQQPSSGSGKSHQKSKGGGKGAGKHNKKGKGSWQDHGSWNVPRSWGNESVYEKRPQSPQPDRQPNKKRKP